MLPQSTLPSPPSLQASRRLAAGTTRTRRPGLAHPGGPHLHHPHPVRQLTGQAAELRKSAGGGGRSCPPPPRPRRMPVSLKTPAPVHKDDAMPDDTTTIELSLCELREVAGTRRPVRGPHWRSSNVNALTTGGHELRSTPRRRSRREPSGPRRCVTAPGRPSERLRRPATRDRPRRATLRARPSPRPARRSSTPWRKPLRSSTSSDRPLMPRERSSSPPETVPPPETAAPRRRGSSHLRSWSRS